MGGVGNKSQDRINFDYTLRMRPSIASLVASLCIGFCLPVFYGNGEASHLVWMIFGLLIGGGCYFLVSFLISRLDAIFNPKNFAAKQLRSFGQYASPLFTCLLVSLMFKLVI
jgi:hypothetical protein